IGTGITNIARIVFDGNDAISTPPVWNMVGDVPPIAAVVSYLSGAISVGAPFSYMLTLTNNGSATVTNVVLTNALPPGMNLVETSATAGLVSVTDGVVTWHLGAVPN